MDDFETLVDVAGIPVALECRGEPRRLPVVVGRGARRVIRDALDAAATAASVAIEFMPGAIAVQIEHDGEHRELDEAAELAASLGGGLRAVRSRAGARVRAWLPTEGQPPCPVVPLAVH